MADIFSLAIPDVEQAASSMQTCIESIDEAFKNIQSDINIFLQSSWEGSAQKTFVTKYEKWITEADECIDTLKFFKSCLSPAGIDGATANVDILSELNTLNDMAQNFAVILGGSTINGQKNVVYYNRSALESELNIMNDIIDLYEEDKSSLNTLSSYSTSSGFSPDVSTCKAEIENVLDRISQYKSALQTYGEDIDNLERAIKTEMGKIKPHTAKRFQDKTSYEMSALVFSAMSIKAFLELDIDRLPVDQRAAYLNYIFKLLADEEIEIEISQREALLNKLGKMTQAEIMALVYDVDGAYGGDQGSPQNTIEDDLFLLEIIRNYYPNKSDTELQQILINFNGHGCGYTALANTIIVEYTNKPDEFERIFGFPLYIYGTDSKVQFNFDYLITDLYCSSGSVGKSTTPSNRKKILESYLGDKGVSVTITKSKTKANVESIQAVLDEGNQVVLRVRPTKIYEMDGATLNHDTSGGHAIIVTGTTEDGNLIISSWGNQYIVKPDEFPNYENFHLLKPDTWSSYCDYEVVTYGE